jgi:hypothetical protein
LLAYDQMAHSPKVPRSAIPLPSGVDEVEPLDLTGAVEMPLKAIFSVGRQGGKAPPVRGSICRFAPACEWALPAPRAVSALRSLL